MNGSWTFDIKNRHRGNRNIEYRLTSIKYLIVIRLKIIYLRVQSSQAVYRRKF